MPGQEVCASWVWTENHVRNSEKSPAACTGDWMLASDSRTHHPPRGLAYHPFRVSLLWGKCDECFLPSSCGKSGKQLPAWRWLTCVGTSTWSLGWGIALLGSHFESRCGRPHFRGFGRDTSDSPCLQFLLWSVIEIWRSFLVCNKRVTHFPPHRGFKPSSCIYHDKAWPSWELCRANKARYQIKPYCFWTTMRMDSPISVVCNHPYRYLGTAETFDITREVYLWNCQ